jgi:hypothetical protein
MHALVALLLVAAAGKSIQVPTTTVPPKLDGVIEEVWLAADSVSDFVQYMPDEGAVPSERTVVYVMQDDANLYVAFRAWSLAAPPVGQLYGLEDELTLYVDPMDSRQTAYFFKAYASGLWRQGLILDNGASQDWSWDGVWYVGTRLYPDRIECEMRIPFKSIRWRAGSTEWGVNFERMIARKNENMLWTEYKESEGGNRVSGYGKLAGIAPRSKGFYFEFLPEGYARYDETGGDTVETIGDVAERTRLRASLNVKWDITPQTTLNATALPDFAQIESDPYSFNISRYPILLEERRPFFIEGSEIFRFSGLGGAGNFAPLRLFHSRRIGKAVNNQPVPILGGLKLTGRGRGWSAGLLGAATDRVTDTAGVELEPRRAFTALSGRGRLSPLFSGGLLFAGTAADTARHNAVLGADLGFDAGRHKAALELAGSDNAGTKGWAMNSGYAGYMGRFVATAAASWVDDSFSVQDIGYVPWAGQRSLSAMAGPWWNGLGPLRRLYVIPGATVVRQPGSDKYSYNGGVWTNFQMRSNAGGELNAQAGRSFEMDTSFLARSVGLSGWASSLAWNLNGYGTYSHGYNYGRGFIADNYGAGLWGTYYIGGKVAAMLGLNSYWELDPAGKVVAVTSPLSPRLDFRFDSRINFNIYDNIVFTTPETKFDSTRVTANRVGFLFSWNFLPKSWLYVALNDFRVDAGDGLKLVNRVGAVKLRYLFYF